MPKVMPPFTNRLPDMLVENVIVSCENQTGKAIQAELYGQGTEGEAIWQTVTLHKDLTVETRYLSEVEAEFTDKFDAPDYEAFYLAVSDAIGSDESLSLKNTANRVKSALDNLSDMAMPKKLFRIVYYHKMAGETDTAYVRASASGNALLKFAQTCVQPDEIDIRTCEEVEVTE